MNQLTRDKIKEITNQKHSRAFTMKLDRAAINEDERTVEAAFSSEDEYRRWFGIEILGHEKGEYDLEFLAGGTAPLLDQHNHSKTIGVIEKAWIDKDRKGRAVVRFGKSATAQEYFDDVVDGIRHNISVGYQITDMKLIESNEETGDKYRISWAPFEISFVSVPADKTVGVGKSDNGHQLPQQQGTNTMTPEEKAAKEAEAKAAKEAEAKAARVEMQQQFETEKKDIMAIGKKHGFDNEALNAIGDGKSPAQFRDYVLEELAKKGMKPAETKDVEIGLSEKEAESYSFLRVINALANPANKKAQDAAGFEFEASRAVADKIGSTPNGVFVPLDVQKRELTVGTATAGGHLVATELLTSSFIDLLQNRMLTKRMGARVLSGLVGDVAIPRQTGGATTYWVGESTDGTPSDQSFDQVALTPKTQAAITKISRKLLLQSSLDVEAFVRADLALAQALGGDLAAIAGAGGNDPFGIINTSGVGSVIGGSEGAAPTWDHIVQLWTEVAQDNADYGSLGYMTNSKVLGKLMQTEKASGTGRFIVEQFPDNDGFTGLAGSRAGVSNQVPGDLDKGSSTGVCSALIYGNWADLIIAMWGSLDIVVDGISSNDGGVTVKTYQDMDVAPRNAGSFSVMLDALTS